ncbi:MAG TPA: MarR family transcriptional regulator [Actinotalea sp.]|jgi:DNA-binding MarR family transcriptional regulator
MELSPVMDLFDVLVRYETHLWNHLDDRLRTDGQVSLATLSALRVVRAHAGECRVQELRTDLGITVGAASKVVDRLERDGLAVRGANPDDRRSSLVTLTPAGDVAHDEGVALLEAALADHLADEAGVEQATLVLTRLMTTLTAPAEVSR